MISDYSNLDIGLYFYSEAWDGIVDYKIFDGGDCDKMKYCEVIESKGSRALLFSMDESSYMSLNLIPKMTSTEMKAALEYRLVNKL